MLKITPDQFAGLQGQGDALLPCEKNKNSHWIKVRLIALPDLTPREKWWPGDSFVTFADQSFTADTTDGHKDSALDGQGSCRYENIPAGACSWKFTGFFDEIESALKPQP